MRHHPDSHGQFRHTRGWKRQHHDPRDLQLAQHAPHLAAMQNVALAPVLSLRASMPMVRDQLDIGSCTANASVVVTEFCLTKETKKIAPPLSRLDLYAITRELEGTPLSEDSGCQVRDVFKASQKWGVCKESTWPYMTARFSMAPPRRAAVEALHHRAASYHAVSGVAGIRACLTEGYPLIFGFDCYESLMSDAVAQSGEIPLPTATEASIGGHCVAAIGYDDARQMVEIQNSWGRLWGDQGFGWLPYGYVEQALATDFWTLRYETTQ